MATRRKTLRTPRLFASGDVTFPSTAFPPTTRRIAGSWLAGDLEAVMPISDCPQPLALSSGLSFGVGSACRSARQLFELSERGGVKLKSRFTNDRANDGRRFINPVVHQRDGNWSRARRDQPIDRFDEFFGVGHVNSLRCGFKTALASCAALRG
jgi:hypothetical protein